MRLRKLQPMVLVGAALLLSGCAYDPGYAYYPSGYYPSGYYSGYYRPGYYGRYSADPYYRAGHRHQYNNYYAWP